MSLFPAPRARPESSKGQWPWYLEGAFLIQPHLSHGQQHLLIQGLQLPLGFQMLTFCY